MMKKLFQYDLTGRMQSELCALDVFSTDWDGTIYHWRKNQFRIAKLGAELDGKNEQPRDFVIPYVFMQFDNPQEHPIDAINAAKAEKEMKKTVRECIQYLTEKQYIEKIMEHNMEAQAANKIVRIDLFKKFWGGFTLRYDGEDGKPNYLRVSKKIHDYDQLVDLLQRKMKESV